MKKQGILNSRLSAVVAAMGHTDTLVVGDAGLPVPPGVERIDLALTQGVPGCIETIQAVLSELKVERITLAEEMRTRSAPLHDRVLQLFEGIPVTYVSHEELKSRSASACAVVRTGEFTPFANVILSSGVVF